MKKKTSQLAAASLLATLSALPTLALAVEEGPENPLPLNLSLVSEYRYRGISQSRLKPAVQGGADYSNPNGLYLGTWASTIKWIKDAGEIAQVDTGSTDFEWDFYGGWKTELAKDVTLDLGGLYYYYMNNKLGDVPGSANANTFELYGAIGLGAFTAKYSQSMTNLFGFVESKGSKYVDLSYAADLGDGWTVTPHYGYQKINGNDKFSYSDYSVTVGKDLGKGFNVSLALIGTDADETLYVSPDGKFLGKNTAVLMLKFNF